MIRYNISMGDPFDILDYGTRLERVLLAQRGVSEILKNAGERGTAREFFVQSVLKRFLPANIVIGSGEIVDGTSRSNQQDLILYRGNFPVIDSLAGAHLYLAEGVLATIEVKTSLDDREIVRATENITSVRQLKVSDYGLGPVTGDDIEIEDNAWGNGQGSTSDPRLEDPLLRAASERIWSYVFAFGGLKPETIVEHARTAGWLAGDGPDCLCVLGSAFGVSADSPIKMETATSEDAFHIEATAEPLGWWLGHLVWALARRYRWPVLHPYFPEHAK